MPYLIQSDLSEVLSEQELTQLTDDEKLGVVNAARVASVIASASAEIDGYIAVRYSLPLASIPALVKGWALAIALYRLYMRRHNVSAAVRQGYEDTIDQLKSVARGTLSLGIDPSPASSDQASHGEVLSNDSAWSKSINEW